MADEADYASALLRDTREEVARADTKASLLLASAGVVVGALLAGLIAGRWSPFELDNAVEWLWWLSVALAAVALTCLALAVWPRFASRRHARPDVPSYFGDVVRFASAEELLEHLPRTRDNSDIRTSDQIFQVSRIVKRKYVFVRAALVLLGVAAVTATLSVLISNIIGKP